MLINDLIAELINKLNNNNLGDYNINLDELGIDVFINKNNYQLVTSINIDDNDLFYITKTFNNLDNLTKYLFNNYINDLNKFQSLIINL